MNRIGRIALAVVLLFAADAVAGEKSRETPKELRGVWVFDHAISDGKYVDDSVELKGATLEVVDGMLIETLQDSDGTKTVVKESFEIDSSNLPKRLNNLRVVAVGSVLYHIHYLHPRSATYEVKGDTLTICIDDEDSEDFSSQNARMIVLKKQADPDATPQRKVTPRRRPRLSVSNLGRRFRR